MDSLIPPIPPTQVHAAWRDEFIELSWQGTGSDVVTQYIVYRRVKGDEAWEIIAYIPIRSDNRGEYIFQDFDVEPGAAYEYALTAVDIYGNESALSENIETNSDS